MFITPKIKIKCGCALINTVIDCSQCVSDVTFEHAICFRCGILFTVTLVLTCTKLISFYVQ